MPTGITTEEEAIAWSRTQTAPMLDYSYLSVTTDRLAGSDAQTVNVRALLNNAVKDIAGDYPIPADLKVADLNSVLVEVDGKGKWDFLLPTAREFADFDGREKVIKPKPHEKLLFISELHVNGAFVGNRLGHKLIAKAEELTNPDRTILLCYPLGTGSMLKTSRLGLDRLESYYEEVGFEVASRDKGDAPNHEYALMIKNNKL
jgi:hypothetical protein